MRITAFSALPLLVAALAVSACGASDGGESRDVVRIVGSSTVFPFGKLVNEAFVRSADFKAPVLEANGTGGGIKLFCVGIGSNTPDVTLASRRMKPEEFEGCVANGVDQIVEIPIGKDGLAMAAANGGITLSLTPEMVYRALAANPFGRPQTAKTWSDIDPSLPNEPILVYGPPTTSGTRDSFEEVILIAGCETSAEMKALAASNEEEFDRTCTELRSDGAFVDQGENDNLIVQKIVSNPRAVGVFGFSFLDGNKEELRGIPLNGVSPGLESIASGDYPGAREMFVYAKKAHVGAIPGLIEYLSSWVESGAPDGVLARAGLIASPEPVRNQAANAVKTLPLLEGSSLE
jgi:phosphate transport system substrate-binding protein